MNYTYSFGFFRDNHVLYIIEMEDEARRDALKRVVLGESLVHGIGVFATVDRGAQGVALPKNRSVVLFEMSDRQAIGNARGILV